MKDHYDMLKVPAAWLMDARTCIARAEAKLGVLSNGQRRDLLKDNKPWGSLTIAVIVDKLHHERPEPAKNPDVLIISQCLDELFNYMKDREDCDDGIPNEAMNFCTEIEQARAALERLSK